MSSMITRIALLMACLVLVSVCPVQCQSDFDSAKKHYDLGRSYSSSNDPRAENEFRLAIGDRGGHYPEAWEWLSRYLSGKLRFQESADAWRKYISQVRPKASGNALERLSNLDRVVELKSKGDTGQALSSEELIELTSLVYGFGTTADATIYAEKAVMLYPGSSKALVKLARLIENEQRNKALDLLKRAVELDPHEPSTYLARGWHYYWVQHNPAHAEIDFRKVIELSKGSNAGAWAGLGYALAQGGRLEEAISAFRKYQSIRPESAAHNDGEITRMIELLESNTSRM